MPSATRLAKIRTVATQRQKDFVLVCEDIHDPHNVQAMVRTCDAFGIHDVYLIFEQETPFDPKRVGKASSSTANKWVDFHSFHSTKACLTQLKKDGYTIIATLLDTETTSLYDLDVTDKKIALLVGNEHHGLSKTAAELSDIHLSIPMVGMVQSLNVSVTAAICIWEFTRQRNATRDLFTLSPQEAATLTDDFLKR